MRVTGGASRLAWFGAGEARSACVMKSCPFRNSEYAARIATGAWKAKKHKAMAEEARQAWAQLKRTTGGRAWMRHVNHGDHHSSAAHRLAAAGKRGTFIYAEIVA